MSISKDGFQLIPADLPLDVLKQRRKDTEMLHFFGVSAVLYDLCNC